MLAAALVAARGGWKQERPKVYFEQRPSLSLSPPAWLSLAISRFPLTRSSLALYASKFHLPFPLALSARGCERFMRGILGIAAPVILIWKAGLTRSALTRPRQKERDYTNGHVILCIYSWSIIFLVILKGMFCVDLDRFKLLIWY